MVGAEWIRHTEEQLDILSDPVQLGHVGFHPFDFHGIMKTRRGGRRKWPWREQLFSSAINSVAAQIQIDRYYSELPPMIFGGVVARSADLKQKIMVYVRRLWDAVRVAEPPSTGPRPGTFAAEFLRGIPWLRSQWCRELLVGAAECNFETLPVPAIQEAMIGYC